MQRTLDWTTKDQQQDQKHGGYERNRPCTYTADNAQRRCYPYGRRGRKPTNFLFAAVVNDNAGTEESNTSNDALDGARGIRINPHSAYGKPCACHGYKASAERNQTQGFHAGGFAAEIAVHAHDAANKHCDDHSQQYFTEN